MTKVSGIKSLLAAAFAVTAVSSGIQAEESPWLQHGEQISSRLISAHDGTPREGKVLLGLELRVAEGWKTYWRSPGEAGLPPVVTTEGGSKDGIEMKYPLPKRFELFGLQTYGYEGQVVFPMYVDSNLFEGSKVTLKSDFMVCKDICIPYTVSHTLDRGEGEDRPALHKMSIDYALKQVPHREGDAGAGLEIVQAKVQGSKGHERLLVEVRGSNDLSAADVLPESNLPVKFGKPVVRAGGAGKSTWFAFPVMIGYKKVSLRGDRICLTFSDGQGNAIERDYDLPGA